MEKEIAIYWWAFNPPTLAHYIVIQKVLTLTSIEKIILTPDWQRIDKDFWIRHENRRKMIELFYQKLLKMWLKVELCDYFLEWKNKNNTTTMSVNQYFNDNLWFIPWHIFWTDVAKDMPNWSGNTDWYIEQKLKKIFIPRPWYEFNNMWLDNYMFLDIAYMLEISSTMAREMIKNKQKTKDVLFPEIREYIDKNNLYQ